MSNIFRIFNGISERTIVDVWGKVALYFHMPVDSYISIGHRLGKVVDQPQGNQQASGEVSLTDQNISSPKISLVVSLYDEFQHPLFGEDKYILPLFATIINTIFSDVLTNNGQSSLKEDLTELTNLFKTTLDGFPMDSNKTIDRFINLFKQAITDLKSEFGKYFWGIELKEIIGNGSPQPTDGGEQSILDKLFGYVIFLFLSIEAGGMDRGQGIVPTPTSTATPTPIFNSSTTNQPQAYTSIYNILADKELVPAELTGDNVKDYLVVVKRLVRKFILSYYLRLIWVVVNGGDINQSWARFGKGFSTLDSLHPSILEGITNITQPSGGELEYLKMLLTSLDFIPKSIYLEIPIIEVSPNLYIEMVKREILITEYLKQKLNIDLSNPNPMFLIDLGMKNLVSGNYTIILLGQLVYIPPNSREGINENVEGTNEGVERFNPIIYGIRISRELFKNRISINEFEFNIANGVISQGGGTTAQTDEFSPAGAIREEIPLISEPPTDQYSQSNDYAGLGEFIKVFNNLKKSIVVSKLTV